MSEIGISKAQIDLLFERSSEAFKQPQKSNGFEQREDAFQASPPALSYDYLLGDDFTGVDVATTINRHRLCKDDIEKIALAMTNKETPSEGGTPAGYTYLGQFIAHDIVPSTTLENRRVVTPMLNLDSVYFEYAELLAHGAQSEHDAAKIRLNGQTTPTELGNDLFRVKKYSSADGDSDSATNDVQTEGEAKEYYVAQIPEHRNDGNVIVSQLHMEWVKLHNRLVDVCRKELEQGQEIDDKGIYDYVRYCVVLLYQHVVVEDYLQTILHHRVYEHYFLKIRDLKYKSFYRDDGFKLPLEFTRGAFRFSHTMVRGTYILNDRAEEVSLSGLFAKHKELDRTLKIKWERFFGEQATNKATRIGLDVIPRMNDLQRAQLGDELKFSQEKIEHGIFKLIEEDLKASSVIPSAAFILNKHFEPKSGDSGRTAQLTKVVGISSMEDFFKNLDFGKSALKNVTIDGDRKLDLHSAPFWLFVLLEAEQYRGDSGLSLYGGDIDTVDGGRLGPLASMVIAETFRMSIEHCGINIFTEWGEQKKAALGPMAKFYLETTNSFRSLGMLELINLKQ